MDLKVPRDREGGHRPQVFERYKRAKHLVNNGIHTMFLRGVSARKVGEILDVLFGERLLASYFSRISM